MKKKIVIPNELELKVLEDISKVLVNLHIKEALGQVLDVLSKDLGMKRGTITLFDRRGDLKINVAQGLTASEKSRGRYKVGEGITGKVVETGEPIVVPRISKEPMFLDRTGARDQGKEEISFICVPIKMNSIVLGAFSVDKLFIDDSSFEADVRLIGIIAFMIAQSIRTTELVQEERAKLHDENEKLKGELKNKYNITNIVGNSSKMHEVYNQIVQVADSKANVLIRGESGTGKELVAHAVHYNSLRADKPFIKVNVAALPEALLESELFGHEKGAFTDAHQLKIGRFERANGGTIFLDEIGDLSQLMQVKLLRVLQEKEIERVGGTETIPINVRVIAATNKNLEEAIKTNSFREDLYYRLNVFAIYLPTLRVRKSDIMLLADHFINKHSEDGSKVIKRVSTSAIEMLMAYHWPGNVRELENVIERAVLLCKDHVIHGYHLPPTLQTSDYLNEIDVNSSGGLTQKVFNYEKELIVDSLKKTRGIRAKAAKTLKITERIINYKITKYDIDPNKYR